MTLDVTLSRCVCVRLISLGGEGNALYSPNCITPTSPKLPRDTCYGEVSGKSATCHGEVADMDHVTGKSRGSFGVSNHHDMSRRFERITWQVGDKPVYVVLMEFGNEHDVIIYVFRLRSLLGSTVWRTV